MNLMEQWGSGKLGGAFATEQYIHGGAENAIHDLLLFMMVMGMMVYDSQHRTAHAEAAEMAGPCQKRRICAMPGFCRFGPERTNGGRLSAHHDGGRV